MIGCEGDCVSVCDCHGAAVGVSFLADHPIGWRDGGGGLQSPRHKGSAIGVVKAAVVSIEETQLDFVSGVCGLGDFDHHGGPQPRAAGGEVKACGIIGGGEITVSSHSQATTRRVANANTIRFLKVWQAYGRIGETSKIIV